MRIRCLQLLHRQRSVSCASAATTAKAGLLFECGQGDEWDAGAVANPIVRVFPRGDGQRWTLWYTGRAKAAQNTDLVLPAAGAIGVLLRVVYGNFVLSPRRWHFRCLCACCHGVMIMSGFELQQHAHVGHTHTHTPQQRMYGRL